VELKSVLGRRDVLALAFGAIIGWGWVVLSGPMIDQAGTLGSIVAVLVAAVMVIFVGLAYAELTSALPRAGGALAFTYRALGPGWAWVCGWALVLAYVGVCAFEAVAMATVVNYLLPGLRLGHLYSVAGSDVYLSWIVVGVLSALLVGIINWVGVKTSARVQQAATWGLLLIGVAFFFASNINGRVENLHPHFTSSDGVLRVIILMPFLMVGFDIIPQTAEEIKIPLREVGKIILLSIFMAAAWYVLVQWGVGLSLPPEVHKNSELPTADAAVHAFRFAPAAAVMVFGGLLGILTTWNAFLVGATRLLFGMGRAQMLPQIFARIHPRYHTPVFGILFVTLCSLLAPFLGRKALVWLANAASLGVVVAYFLVSVSFVQLRRKHPQLPRPYRVRHGRLVGYAATVITLLFILLYLPFSPSSLVWPQEWGIVLAWVLLGIIAYALGRLLHPAIDRAAQERIILGQYATVPANPDSQSLPTRLEQP